MQQEGINLDAGAWFIKPSLLSLWGMKKIATLRSQQAAQSLLWAKKAALFLFWL